MQVVLRSLVGRLWESGGVGRIDVRLSTLHQTCISKTVRLLWRCARHSDHIATITTDIPFGDTEAHSATETPDGFADVVL